MLHPSAEKLKTGSAKGGPREYTHTRMGVHKDRGFKEGGDVIRPTLSVVSSINWDVVYLIEKIKKRVTKKYLQKQQLNK